MHHALSLGAGRSSAPDHAAMAEAVISVVTVLIRVHDWQFT